MSTATGKSAIRATRSRVRKASRGVLKCSAVPRTMTIVMAKGWPTIDTQRATDRRYPAGGGGATLLAVVTDGDRVPHVLVRLADSGFSRAVSHPLEAWVGRR